MTKTDIEWHKTPNQIVDELLPFLEGGELKILMYAVRHILGWQDVDPEKGKRISNSIFAEGTGLSIPTVIKYRKVLIEAGILLKIGKPTRKGQLWKIGKTPNLSAIKDRKNKKAKQAKSRMSKVRKPINDINPKKAPIKLVEVKGINHLPVNVINPHPLMTFTPDWLMTLTQLKTSLLKTPSKDKKNSENEFSHRDKTDIIKAWIDNLPAKPLDEKNPYVKKGYISHAQKILEAGYTVEQVSSYVKAQCSGFWKDKKLPFGKVLSDMPLWLMKNGMSQQTATQPQPKPMEYDPSINWRDLLEAKQS